MAESARVKGEERREMCDASQRNVQRLQRCDFMSGWQTHGRKIGTDAKLNVSADVAEYGK